MRVFKTVTGAAIGASTLSIAATLSSVAQAQTAPDPVQESGEIVVTGSRIARTPGETASPQIIVAPEEFQKNPSITLEQTLNRLPQFVAGQNASSNDDLGGGITSLSLRGLGSNRTLVLLDSHRIVSSSGDGTVDISLVPDLLLKRVDVLTGGASSAYGSDAIAGVVNFVIDHDFRGVKLDAQSGISEQGDGGQYRLGVAGGTSFADGRGSLVGAFSYGVRNQILNAARPFSELVYPSFGLTTGSFLPDSGNAPSQASVDAVFYRYGTRPGTVDASELLGFNADGSLFQYQDGVSNYRGALGNGYVIQDGSLFYSANGAAPLITPYRRLNGYLSGAFDITDHVQIYLNGLVSNYRSQQFFSPVGVFSDIPVTNPFVPADLRTILASRDDPTADLTIRKRYLGVGKRIANFDATTYLINGGLKGDVGPGDWKWDVFGSYGAVRNVRRTAGTIQTAALDTLLKAADGGRSLCEGGLNPFGDQPISSACRAYLLRSARSTTTLSQTAFEANLQGTILTLPAGKVRAAIGGTYRRDTYKFSPDPQLVRNELESFGDPGTPVNGGVDVKEFYGELLVPLLAEIPLIERLDLDLGGRVSRYSTAGRVKTYRAGLNWAVVQGLNLRGSYARAARSPSIGELFAPQATSFPVIGFPGGPGQGDPCDVRSAYRNGSSASQVRALCAAQGVPQRLIDSYTFAFNQLDVGVSGGNPDLRTERADTFTAGVVIAPKRSLAIFSDVSLSVDFYDIKADDVIGSIDGSLSLQKCFNFDGSNPSYSPTNIYCGFIRRNGTNGQISRLGATLANLGSLETSGVDIVARGRIDFGGSAGSLLLNTTVTRLLTYKVQNFAGDPATDYVGSIGFSSGTSARPRWKGLTNVTYSIDGINLGVQWRYIGGMKDELNLGDPDSGAADVSARSYFDINAKVDVADGFSLRLGVLNVGNVSPPIYSSFVQSNTDPGTYDVIGRSFYVGATARF